MFSTAMPKSPFACFEAYNQDGTMIPYLENSHLYSMHEMHSVGMAPIRAFASASKHMFTNPLSPWSYTDYGRHMAAASELVERITQKYPKPEFGIKSVKIGEKLVPVKQSVVWEKPFCKL